MGLAWLSVAFCLLFALDHKFVYSQDVGGEVLFFDEFELSQSMKEANLALEVRAHASEAIQLIVRHSAGFKQSATILNQRLVRPSVNARLIDSNGEFVLNFARSLCKRRKCKKFEKMKLSEQPLPESLKHLCDNKSKKKCPKKTLKYRTIDGTCNNLIDPSYGSAETPQDRFIPSDYHDGIEEPRRESVTKRPLPSPRMISERIMKDYSRPHSRITTLFVFFGQLVDHDLTLTPATTANGTEIICCKDNENFVENNDDCIPVSDISSSRGETLNIRSLGNRIPDFFPSSKIKKQITVTENGGKIKVRSKFNITKTASKRLTRKTQFKVNIDGNRKIKTQSTSVKSHLRKRTRKVSKTVIRRSKRATSLWCMNAISNNLVFSTVVKKIGQTDMLCCPGIRDEATVHPACLPIEIPQSDPFYSRFNQQCMEFVRSSTAPNLACTFGVREQPNQITAFLDASFVYSSDEHLAEELRLGQRGLMKTSGDRLLPIDTKECDSNGENCLFNGGEERLNEIPTLTVFQTLFLREHNRLADIIWEAQPSWDDERIFQEARKILIGQLQNIVYTEFLPLVIGPDAIRKYRLQIPRRRNSKLYNRFERPFIKNAFSTAAFRFGHTLLPTKLKMAFKDKSEDFFDLHTKFSKPFILKNESVVEGIAKGMAEQSAEDFDVFLTPSVTKHLFQADQQFGLDLAALNIQRGRDHGLPSYNKYREFCKLPPIESFDDIPGTQSCCFSSVYDHVDDIDLFVGGISEDAVPGGVVGQTFACLIGNQFSSLMRGDRFFFVNGNEDSHMYTNDQIKEFRKANIARIICDNIDVDSVQRKPFLKPSDGNRVQSCDTIPKPDIHKLIPSV